MGIPLPSLQDIAAWLIRQLKTWFAIVVDTRSFAKEVAQSLRADADDVVIKLISLAVFVFLLDTLLSLPIDVLVWNLDIFSPPVLLSALALFCTVILTYTACVHIFSRFVTRNGDLRFAFAFVLLMLAFHPILHLCEAPTRVMMSRDMVEALYVGNIIYVIESDQYSTSLFVVSLFLAIMFVRYMRRSTIALAEIYLVGHVRAFFIVTTAIAGRTVVEVVFVAPLFLRLANPQG